MKEKYHLLSKNNKRVIWLISLLLAMPVVYFLSKDYLQADMLGQWQVTEVIGPNKKQAPATITISTREILFDGQKATTLFYGSKSKRANFKRKDHEDKIIYSFALDNSEAENKYYDYLLVYDKKNPENLQLLAFDQTNVQTICQLERVKKDHD